MFVLLFFLSLTAKEYVLNEQDLRSIPSRDLYDLLTKINSVHGVSTGETGQPVFFSRIGIPSYHITLFIDDVPYGDKDIQDLSFISVELTEKIIIDDSPFENSGITVKLYSKDYSDAVPFSEVRYKDAFYNYRTLTAEIAQNFNENSSFIIRGEIQNFKDIREYSDRFRYPYEKQSYGLKIFFSQIGRFMPVADISYLTENKYSLYSDSLYRRPETVRTVISINNNSEYLPLNKLSLIHLYKENGISSNSFTLYDKFMISNSENSLEVDISINSFVRGSNTENSSNASASFKKEMFFDAEIKVAAGFSGTSNDNSALKLNFQKEITSFLSVENFNTLYSENKDQNGVYADTEFFENSFYVMNRISGKTISTGLDLGYDLINNISENYSNEYIRSGISVFSGSSFCIKTAFIKRISGRSLDLNPDINITGSAVYKEKYFNDKLDIMISIFHRYSEYKLSGADQEIMNNFGFNLSAKIVNFEFFFGTDNFIRDKYTVNNKIYRINEHYKYSTINGFEMPLKDEIWGVRWVFYN